MKTALVCGAGGFIGHNLVKRLKRENFWVRGVDVKYPEFEESQADEFLRADLATVAGAEAAVDREFAEIYQLAADMGGAGYIFTGDSDADIVHNSALINLNVLHQTRKFAPGRIFYSSSACVYPLHNQLDPDTPDTAEDSVYPAFPDSEYGWEKLFSERLYLTHHRNFGLPVRVARFHNIFGPLGAWNDGKEKVPAAMCRKVAMAADPGEIEIWGDGKQTRSFLYIDECLDAMRLLMDSNVLDPINIGSDEMVSINQLATMVADVAGKTITLKHIDGPLGVRGRTSDNRMIEEKLGWRPGRNLRSGLETTYAWISEQVKNSQA